MKTALMYGGGNIGRGFVGALFSLSGYRVNFVDVAKGVVDELREKQRYPIRIVSNAGCEDIMIENVSAVDGNDTQATAEAIAECDIMATAVGARILKFIVPNIVAGLRKRWAEGARPLNIIICENLNDANRILEGMIRELLSDEEQALFTETVGLVEASIGRMVPVQTDEMKDGEPLRVCVERYGFLPVDKSAFKGKIPVVKGMVPSEPFDFYVKRKLFVHNMGHATTAYLGDIFAYPLICEAIADADIRIIVREAMTESAIALSRRYDVPLDALVLHICDLVGRFGNAALKDTCARVGADPARKLSPDDRLSGALTLAVEQGITPVYICAGIAAGMRRYLAEAGMAFSVENARKVLSEVCHISPSEPVSGIILRFCEMIRGGITPAALRKEADAMKAASLHNII